MRRPLVLAPLVAAVALATASCGAPTTKGRLLVTAAGPATGEVALTVRPLVQAAPRALLDAATNVLTREDVHHVVIKLYLVTLDPDTEDEVLTEKASLEVPASRMDERLTFARLVGGRTYRVRGEAYATAGTGQPIHDPGFAGRADIEVDDYREQNVLDVPIRLKAVPRLVVQDFAGGRNPFDPNDGTDTYANHVGTAARFKFPFGVVYAEAPNDAAGEGFLYVADKDNFRVRRVDPRTADVQTFAGGCTAGDCAGLVDDQGQDARFGLMYGIGANATHLFVADWGNHAIRRIDLLSQVVDTVAGGDTTGAFVDDVAGETARFDGPSGVAAADDGTVYVADSGNHVIRKIANDVGRTVTTLAGSQGAPGLADAAGTAAQFTDPTGVALGPDGALYVADRGNHAIRRVALTAPYAVTTVAGGNGAGETDGDAGTAQFNSPQALVVAPTGTIYVSTTSGHTIRKVRRDGSVQTIAGVAGNPGDVEGPTDVARFFVPGGIALGPDGSLFVSDGMNHKIRRIL